MGIFNAVTSILFAYGEQQQQQRRIVGMGVASGVYVESWQRCHAAHWTA
jgi:hypothetical protein